MDNASCIYWFSGTGNSLYAAKKLSADLGGLTLLPITEKVSTGTVGGKGAKIGFVFPSYFGNLPRAVRAFIDDLEISPDTYLFAIITMGAVGQGTVAALKSALGVKGLQLSYGRGIMMPANYVLKYNPADAGKSDASMEKADKRLGVIAADIAAGKQLVKTLPITATNLYKNIAELDTSFFTTGACTSCGLCEKICPVKNIQLENGKPVWLHHCEHCVACINWCPAKAIEYGNVTQKRRRYCNQRIAVSELMQQE